MSETAIRIPTGCDFRDKNLVQVRDSSEPRYLLSKLSRSPWTLRTVVSAALVIPCFWRRIVSSADLQSHLYNAWLAKLIQDGNVHGLWIGRQSTNFVVDLLLAWLMRVFGVSAAERVATTVLVLLFFWGGFQFLSKIRGRPAYWVAPWLAILSYGYVFQQGLLNYYFSCGVVLWLFAALWRRPIEWGMLGVSPLLILAYLAHPLPVLWFLGVLPYCRLAQRLQLRFQILLFLGSASVLFLIRRYIVARYLTIWELRQLLYWTGADQALVYGWIYLAVALGFLLFIAILLNELENRWRVMVSVPAQAYFLTAVTIVVIPSSIGASFENAWAEYIAERLSLLSGVLLLAVVGGSLYRRWHLAAGLTTAVIFFGALYTDIGKQARVEGKMQELVQALPAGERVILYDQFAYQEERGDLSTREQKLTHLAARFSSIFTERLNSTHLLSRACLGHCFDYMNYEPSTSQFRIHAVPGNPVVLASQADVVDVVDGTYKVKAIDLPLYVLLRCGERPGDIRMHPLAEGESGRMLACPGTTAAW